MIGVHIGTQEMSLRNNMDKNSTKETLESLWEYCTSNNRMCPIPMKWNDLFGTLKNTKQNPDGGWTPSLPFILNGWEMSMPFQKSMRFKEHIQWAADNNQLEEVGTYLRTLSETEWAHYGEM